MFDPISSKVAEFLCAIVHLTFGRFLTGRQFGILALQIGVLTLKLVDAPPVVGLFDLRRVHKFFAHADQDLVSAFRPIQPGPKMRDLTLEIAARIARPRTRRQYCLPTWRS